MRLSLHLAVALAGLAVVSLSVPLHAQTRSITWVASYGSYSNPGSRQSPCLEFAGALPLTKPGGEIRVVDPGDYAMISISKSIVIDGGGLATINTGQTGGYGVLISDAAADVIIRNLAIKGSGVAAPGVVVDRARSVLLENVTIDYFTEVGIKVLGPCQFTLRNVTITNCPSGVVMSTPSSYIFATMEHVTVRRATIGVWGGNGTRVALKSSDLSMNTYGLRMEFSTVPSKAEVDDCAIAYCTNAAVAGPGASVIHLTNSTIANNTTALVSMGGTFGSTGSNSLMGNISDGVAMYAIAKK